jgi:hypothetical protein
MMMMTMLGHECEREMVWGGSLGGRRSKGKDTEGRRGWKYAMYVHMKTA